MLHTFSHPKYWPTWVGLFVVRTLSLLPLPVLAVFGTVIGKLTHALMASRRNVARRNISACFPHWSTQKVNDSAKQCFQFIGQSVFYSGFNWWASPSRLNRLVNITEREHYDQALAAGKNIILLAPHFCALEIAGIVLSQERPMISMYQHTKNRLVDHFVKQGRGRFDGVLVERKEPLRSLIKLIRKGYPFYYLPDQDARTGGIFAPFFGIQASTVPYLGKFAAMSKAAVIPVSTRILPHGGGFEIRLKKPLENFPSGDDSADTTAMNKAIEDIVVTMPEQYFWVHKRFKTRPQGEPSFYD